MDFHISTFHHLLHLHLHNSTAHTRQLVMDQAALGKKALADSNFEAAIKHYTNALAQSPTSPVCLIGRSTAYQRAKQYDEALNDANRAVIEARKRAKRELIVEAQFRRGVALYSLERYGDAEFVFAIVKRMDEKYKGLDLWMNKCKMSLSKLGEDSAAKKDRTVEEVPTEAGLERGSEVKTGGLNGNEKTQASSSSAPSSTTTTATTVPPTSIQSQQTPADKIRHDWYQNAQNVYFTLLAKGVPPNKAQIDIAARSLSISFPLATGSSYDLHLEPLSGEVLPEQSSKKIFSTKVEIVLAKKVQGEKWKTLEAADVALEPSTTGGAATMDAVKAAVTAPAYPTSSKHGAKDWEKVVAEAQAAGKDPNAKPGSLEDDDDYEGGDEANHFFKKLFKGASPEVQRAMMKSYTESNGTALSTNWEEVSKGKVETTPPDGMVARPWSS